LRPFFSSFRTAQSLKRQAGEIVSVAASYSQACPERSELTVKRNPVYNGKFESSGDFSSPMNREFEMTVLVQLSTKRLSTVKLSIPKTASRSIGQIGIKTSGFHFLTSDFRRWFFKYPINIGLSPCAQILYWQR
jgi:hypothetical protein